MIEGMQMGIRKALEGYGEVAERGHYDQVTSQGESGQRGGRKGTGTGRGRLWGVGQVSIEAGGRREKARRAEM